MNAKTPQNLDFAILDEAAVRKHLSMRQCIALIRQAMQRVSAGGCALPLRSMMAIPGTPNCLGQMMGYLDDPEALGIKVLALYPDNPARGLSSHLGIVLLMDPPTGRPIACLDAASITAIRTAAASAVATDSLARADARKLAILGTGEQAESHIEAIALVRDLESITVWGRSFDRAAQLADEWSRVLGVKVAPAATVQEAISDADIVCTTTASADPIVEGGWLRPGMHLNLVGASVASKSEVDVETVRRGRYFVDYRASAEAQAGELKRGIDAGVVTIDHIIGEIGEVLAGTIEGRRSADEITIYKSLGLSAQDLAAASHIMAEWRRSHRL